MEESYLRWLLAVLNTSLTKVLKVDLMKTMDRLRIMMKSLRKTLALIIALLSRALLFRFPTRPERGSGMSNVNDHRSELFKALPQQLSSNSIVLYTLHFTFQANIFAIFIAVIYVIPVIYLVHLIYLINFVTFDLVCLSPVKNA